MKVKCTKIKKTVIACQSKEKVFQGTLNYKNKNNCLENGCPVEKHNLFPERCFIVVVVVVWKGIHSRSDTNKTGAQGLSFNYPRQLNYPDQILAVMLLNQHRA